MIAEKFELHLKTFCQLTIELIDLKQESWAFVKTQHYENVAALVSKKKLISEQLLAIIKEIETENNKTAITSENVNQKKLISNFLKQFDNKNDGFIDTINLQINELQNDLNDKMKAYNFKNTDNLKLEIIKLQKSKSEKLNW
jgi:hypothetical protein